MAFNKNTIQNLLNSNPELINAAIRIIGENQTADELGSRHTKYENGIGFTASYGTIGTVLYQFVTGRDCKRQGHPVRWTPKSLVTQGHVLDRTRDMRRFKYRNQKYASSTPLDIAKMIAVLHWRQLSALLTSSNLLSRETNTYFGVNLETEEPKTMVIKFTRVIRQTERAMLLEKVDAEGIAWERWIPKSMIVKILDHTMVSVEMEIKRPA